MKIILDMDSTLTPTHDAILKLYREMTGDYSTNLEGFKWDMSDKCPLWTHDQFQAVFRNPNLFKHMELFDDCEKVLKRLHGEGHTFQVCSLNQHEGIPHKTNWIKEKLPFIDEINIIPIEDGVINFDKSSVVGDIIVDDRIDCLLSSPCKYKICYGLYDWNKDWTGLRVMSWREIENVIDFIKIFDFYSWREWFDDIYNRI